MKLITEPQIKIQLEETRGPQGPAGPRGKDGYSPAIEVKKIAGGHRISVTDVNGKKSFNVMDGDGGGFGGGDGSGIYFETDETLTLEDGILSVNTADVVEEDNTLPVTSAAVYAEVGNINALLATI